MRSLLDTNILVYADAGDEPAKQQQALGLIKQHLTARSGVLSTQVLQEFVNVASRKLRLPPGTIRERLAFYERFEIVNATPDLIAGALDIHVMRSVSFYDALIVQAALAGGCQCVLTEDMQHGASFGPVRIVNPFAA